MGFQQAGEQVSGRVAWEKIRMRLLALAGFNFLGLWACSPADASISFWTPPTIYEATVGSDMWVRARVLESRTTEDLRYGSSAPERYDLAVTLEILDSTDARLPGTIEAEIKNASEEWAAGDVDRFLALTRKNGAYVRERAPAYSIQEDGWIEPFHNSKEALATDHFMWRLLQDMRLLVDGDGVAAPAIQAHYESLVEDGSPTEVILALEWLVQLKAPRFDAMALAKNVRRHYMDLAARVEENPDEEDAHRGYPLGRLFSAAALEVSRMQHAGAARLLEDMYWEDQSTHHFLYYASIAPLLAVPATGEQLSILASLLGDSVALYESDLELLSRIPGKPMDELLWLIAETPEELGIRNPDILLPLWDGLVRRGDSRIRDYFRNLILRRTKGEALTGRNFAAFAEGLAYKHYAERPRTTSERDAELRWLANEGAAGNIDCLKLLASLLRSQDRHLVPIFIKFESSIPYQTAFVTKEIILRIPDPAFLPLLKSWESDDPSADIIRAFLACGDVEHATALATAHMAAPVPEATPPLLAEDLQDRAELIRAFAEAGNTELALAWITSAFTVENLQRYDRLLVAASKHLDPEDALYRLHLASLDVALLYPVLDGKNAIPWLRWYRDADESFEAFASLSLMVSEEESDVLTLDTLQAQVESTTPFMVAVPYLLRMNHPTVTSLVLEYLEQDLKGFDQWVEDPDDYRRLGVPFLKILVKALESGNIKRRSEAMDACAAVLGRKLDYRLGQPRVYNDIAVAECLQSMRQLIKKQAA